MHLSEETDIIGLNLHVLAWCRASGITKDFTEKALALLELKVFPQIQKKTMTATSTQLLWSSWFHMYSE